MSLILQSTKTCKPHPEGIFPAVCVDVIDLGLVKAEFNGHLRMLPKVKLVFETKTNGGSRKISRSFTTSLHPKARLTEFLGAWRGRAIMPGETINLNKLIGIACTLVVSQQQNLTGQTYAAIDGILRPFRKH